MEGLAELLIEATGPLGGALFRDWHVPAYTGIEEDDSRRYYLYWGREAKGGTLTLTVITESGFFSSAKIEINPEGGAPVARRSWGEIKGSHSN